MLVVVYHVLGSEREPAVRIRTQRARPWLPVFDKGFPLIDIPTLPVTNDDSGCRIMDCHYASQMASSDGMSPLLAPAAVPLGEDGTAGCLALRA